MGLTMHLLRVTYEHIRTGVLGGGDVQVDETPIRYLVPGHGGIELGYSWTFVRPGGETIFHWETSCRVSQKPDFSQGPPHLAERWLQRLSGVCPRAQTLAGSEAIVLARCWAHARRAFHEALDNATRTGT